MSRPSPRNWVLDVSPSKSIGVRSDRARAGICGRQPNYSTRRRLFYPRCRILRRVKVAIDDFGTGHSALGYLTSFPVDVVKIDRSFVDGVDVDPVKSAIVAAVINLSRAVGSTTVVEGVETASQLEHLRELGCTTAQGYYFARPAPAHVLEDLLVAQASVAQLPR